MTTYVLNARVSRAVCAFERTRLTKKFACVALQTFFGEYISINNASINELLDEYDGSIETIETIKIIDSFDDAVTVEHCTVEDIDILFKKVSNVVELPAKTTKNSVVCTIAAKLSKAGVKNPMRVAWQVYRVAMLCLNAIARKCHFDVYSYSYQLEHLLTQHGIASIVDILPHSVCNVLKKHALSLSI